jgi:hypothetical protein
MFVMTRREMLKVSGMVAGGWQECPGYRRSGHGIDGL